MKKLFTAAFFFALAVSPAMAAQSSAQAKGAYAEIILAGAFNDDTDLKNFKSVSGAGRSASMDMDNSFLFEGAIGRDFGDFRLDVSAGRMESDVKNMTLSGAGYEGRGSYSIVPLLLSAYYDVPTNSPVKPFLGAGAGIAWVEYDMPRSGTAFGSDDDAFVPAYHVTLGTGFQINPQLSLVASYRYLWTGEGEFKGYSAAEGASEKVKASFGSHLARFGMRFGF